MLQSVYKFLPSRRAPISYADHVGMCVYTVPGVICVEPPCPMHVYVCLTHQESSTQLSPAHPHAGSRADGSCREEDQGEHGGCLAGPISERVHHPREAERVHHPCLAHPPGHSTHTSTAHQHPPPPLPTQSTQSFCQLFAARESSDSSECEWLF